MSQFDVSVHRAAGLQCSSCHSPHAANVVATFTPERIRAVGTSATIRPATNNLLKRRPGNSASSTAVYGSEWCGACHKGQLSGGAVHNHPVDSVLATANAFYYENVQVLTTDLPTSTTTTGTVGRSNRAFLMPFPRTARQEGHNPICQQCHEDSRNVGTLDPSGVPADAATWSVNSTDGTYAGDNPRFQNFPHETQNPNFLVEQYDDLCTNCHGPLTLP